MSIVVGTQLPAVKAHPRRIYWSLGGEPRGSSPFTISRGFAAPELFRPELWLKEEFGLYPEPITLALSPTHLYYTGWDEGTEQVNLDGTGAIFFGGGAENSGCALDPAYEYLYKTESFNGIRVHRIEGGEESSLSTGGNTRRLAVDSTWIYYTTGEVEPGFGFTPWVGRVKRDGTEDNPEWIDLHEGQEGWGILVVGNRLYWTSIDSSTHQSRVGRAQLNGSGAATKIEREWLVEPAPTEAETQEYAGDLATDGKFLYRGRGKGGPGESGAWGFIAVSPLDDPSADKPQLYNAKSKVWGLAIEP